MRHLLTGAGSGIGAALADMLHARGDQLVLVARDPARAEWLQSRYLGADIIVADLAGALEPAAWLPIESLSSLVHSAGIVRLGPLADATAGDLAEQFAVNAMAPALLTAWALPALRRGRGSVVFVNSGAGLSAHPGWGAYAASKFAVRAIADSLRAEEAAHGVRVTSVYPGRTATPMQQAVKAAEGEPYDADVLIQPETVARLILQVIDLPADATTPEIV
ncbi:MAG: SDR family oxidoreductase, partial [Nocardioides sp.]